MGVLFNFMSFGALVFRPAHGAALIRFALLYAAIAGLNYVMLSALASLGTPVAAGQAICLPALAVTSYLGMRFWVYAVPPSSSQQDDEP